MKDLLGLLNGQRSLSLSRSFFFPGHASGLSTIDIPSMCQCKQKFNLIVLRIVLPPLPPSLLPLTDPDYYLHRCSPIFNRGLIVSRLALNLHRFNQISPILLHGWKFDRRKNSLFFFFLFLRKVVNDHWKISIVFSVNDDVQMKFCSRFYDRIHRSRELFS